MMYPRTRVSATAILCALLSIAYLMSPMVIGAQASAGGVRSPIGASAPNQPMQGGETFPYVPASQTLVNATQTGGDCGSTWNNSLSSDDIRCSYQEVDRSPTDQLGVVILPDGTDVNGWSVGNPCSTDATPWDDLDDGADVNDGDATCRQGSTNGNRVGVTLANPAWTDPTDVDDFTVRASVVARKVASQGSSISVDVRIGASAWNNGGTNSTTTSYVRYTRTLNTNPISGAEWTTSNIDDLRVAARCVDCNPNDRATQIQAKIDAVYNVEYALEARFAWSGLPTSGTQWRLVVECRRLSPGTENVLVQVGQGGNPPSNWKTAYTCTSDADQTFDTYALNVPELNGGAPIIRVWDAQADTPDDTVQGTMSLDVLRIDWTSESACVGFCLSGNVWNEDLTVPTLFYVAVTNNRTNETMYQESETGTYAVNLADFPSGYRIGDEIIVEAVDLNDTGLVNAGESSLFVPAGNEVALNVGLAVSARTNMTSEFTPSPPPPQGNLGDQPSPPNRDLYGQSPASPEKTGGGQTEQLDNCNAPADNLPWTVGPSEDIVCEDRVLHRLNNLLGQGRLTFVSTDMFVDPIDLVTRSVLTVDVGGTFTLIDNPSGGSRIDYLTTPRMYEFRVHGTLHVTASTVSSVYGDPGGGPGGIIFYAGSEGVFEAGSEVSYGSTHGIYAEDVTDLVISDSRVVSNGQGAGNVGHGIFLERSYALVTSGSTISDNDESGIYVRDTGVTKSCYGQPYNYVAGTSVAYWVWCSDGYWHIRWTSDGAPHDFTVTVTYEGGGGGPWTDYGETYEGGLDILEGSEWMTFELRIDGNLAGAGQRFVGMGSEDPGSNPFTLWRTEQPVIRDSTISNNNEGIHGENSAPTIVGNTMSANSAYGVNMCNSLPCVGASRAVIVDNTIDSSNVGVYIDTTQWNLVKDNDITAHGFAGVYIHYGGGHIIQGNTFFGTGGYGLYFYGVTGSDVYVTGNTITEYQGMDLRMSPSVVVEGNTITGITTSEFGVGIRSRYTTFTPDKPIVRGNTISGFRGGPHGAGVYVYHWPSDVPASQPDVGATPLIEGNGISNSYYGVLSSWSGPTIQGNPISLNTWGVYVEGRFDDTCSGCTGQIREATVASNIVFSNYGTNEGAGVSVKLSPTSPTIGGGNNVYGNRNGITVSAEATPTLQSNSIFSNSRYGVYVERAAPVVTGNQIYSNGVAGSYSGVYIYYPAASGPATVRDNNIYSNRDYGVRVYLASPIIEGSTRDAQVIRDNPKSNIYLASSNAVVRGNLVMALPWPIRPASQVGIEVTSYSMPVVEQNDFRFLLYRGILVSGGSTPMIVNDNRIIITSFWWRTSIGIYASDRLYPPAPTIGLVGSGNTIAAPVAGVFIGYVDLMAPTTVAGNSIGTGAAYGVSTSYAPASVSVVGNTVSGNSYGIYELYSRSTVSGNTIQNNGIGIYEYFSYSTSRILGNTIQTNTGDGVRLQWASSQVGGTGPTDKNTISSNGGWGIHMVYGKASNSGLKGATLLTQNTIGPNTLGKVFQEWRLRVQVTRYGIPQGGAAVTVHDRDPAAPPEIPWDQYPTATFMTDASGLTVWITVREYWRDNSDLAWNRELHRFCARWSGYGGSTDQIVVNNVPNPIQVAIVPRPPTWTCP